MSSPSTGLEGSNGSFPGWVYTGNERREWVWRGHPGDPDEGKVVPYPGYPRFEQLLPAAQRSENASHYPR